MTANFLRIDISLFAVAAATATAAGTWRKHDFLMWFYLHETQGGRIRFDSIKTAETFRQITHDTDEASRFMWRQSLLI